FVSDGKAKGVSGVRLNLTEVGGRVVGVVRTELDGYFFFEQVPPGRYRLTIDPDQATRLNLCAADVGLVTIGYEAEVVAHDIDIKTCETPQPVLAQARPEPQSQLADASGASD
ncbi:MAG TPA: carboxypeptidase-like regulatory domain-containing protein, partial [Erythrobacter sp.]|nr:carboxypeptidase-like regulatory domain-containing protein [Erythrobacter sp.]